MKLFDKTKEERIALKVIRLKEAEAVANNPAFQRAFKAIEQNLIRDLRNSSWNRVFYRQAIYNRLSALSWLEGELIAEIEDGKLAIRDLNSNGSK